MYKGISPLHNWVSCEQLNPQSKLLEHCNSLTIILSSYDVFSVPSPPPPPPLVQCCIMHSLFFNTIKNQHCLGQRAGQQKQVLTTTFPSFQKKLIMTLKMLLEQRAIFAPNILKCPKMFCPRLQFLKERKNLFFHLSLELAWEQKWNTTSQLPCNILT